MSPLNVTLYAKVRIEEYSCVVVVIIVCVPLTIELPKINKSLLIVTFPFNETSSPINKRLLTDKSVPTNKRLLNKTSPPTNKLLLNVPSKLTVNLEFIDASPPTNRRLLKLASP